MNSSLAISPIPAIPVREQDVHVPPSESNDDTDGTFYFMPPLNSPKEETPKRDDNSSDSDRTVSDLSAKDAVKPVSRATTAPSTAAHNVDTTTAAAPVPFPDLTPQPDPNPSRGYPSGLVNSTKYHTSVLSTPVEMERSSSASPARNTHSRTSLHEDPFDMLLSPSRLHESDSDFLDRMAEPKPNHYFDQAPIHTCDHGFETQEYLEGQQYAVSDYSTLLAMISRAKAEQRQEAKLKEQAQGAAKADVRVATNNAAAFKRTSEWKERREESLKNMRERKKQLEVEEFENVRSKGQLREHRQQHNAARSLPTRKETTFSPRLYTTKQALWKRKVDQRIQLEKESRRWKDTLEDRLGPLHPRDDWMTIALKNMSPADYELTETVQWSNSYAPPRKFVTAAAAEEFVLREQRKEETEILENPTLMPCY